MSVAHLWNKPHTPRSRHARNERRAAIVRAAERLKAAREVKRERPPAAADVIARRRRGP